MTPFDLLFLALAAAAFFGLGAAAVAAVRGRGARSLTILRRMGVVAALYFGVLILVSALAPTRMLRVG